MHLADVVFKARRRFEDHQEPMDAIQGLFVALGHNGQVIECGWPVVQVRGGYRATVILPEADSLRRSLYSDAVREAMSHLRRGGLGVPQVKVIGQEPDSAEVCACPRRSSLILETDYTTTEVPLRCGDCFGVVPLYRFPPTSPCGTYEDVLCWENRYHCMDALWSDNGPGEEIGYREMSEPDSELSRDGRAVCRRIEKLSKTPTYYYLFRYHGHSLAAERRRPCPGCERGWLLEHGWHDRYDFRCTRCRLVSNVAYELHATEDQVHGGNGHPHNGVRGSLQSK